MRRCWACGNCKYRSSINFISQRGLTVIAQLGFVQTKRDPRSSLRSHNAWPVATNCHRRAFSTSLQTKLSNERERANSSDVLRETKLFPLYLEQTHNQIMLVLPLIANKIYIYINCLLNCKWSCNRQIKTNFVIFVLISFVSRIHFLPNKLNH